MFKKLKEKITEEVKISPQRFQQLTQSVSDRLQNNTANTEENFFSITDDDANTSAASNDPGFTSVALLSPHESRFRRNSNTSIASDVSFLPRYESSSNMYHLQSDLDCSASELEDNTSSSSQLGHLSKEQIYSAFQKSQMRYHKYRGRYTDLARHYKDLEREITKMKSVLVETQDKAIRRVGELKEQCQLEQKAKAHLEGALRDEMDEKQLKIKSLETQIGLLRKEAISEIRNETNSQNNSENLEVLTKYLNEARQEIENLNAKLQETKASNIVFQSKVQEHKDKITRLEAEIEQFSEREKENGLKLAQSKMVLHNELISKEGEINNLKKDNEVLRQSLEAFEIKGSSKVDNLQTQNKNLIDKLENLNKKCNNYENELLKMEQYKLEIRNLNEKITDLKVNNEKLKETNESHLSLETKLEELQQTINKLTAENLELNSNISQQKDEYEKQIANIREDAKKGLLSLESKVRKKFTEEFNEKEEHLKQSFNEKLKNIKTNHSSLKETQLKLMEKEEQLKDSINQLNTLRKDVQKKDASFKDLEKIHLELITECNDVRNINKSMEIELAALSEKFASSEAKIIKLQDNINNLEDEVNIARQNNAELIQKQEEYLLLEKELVDLRQQNRLSEEREEVVEMENTESHLLTLKVDNLEKEKLRLLDDFENERKAFEELINDNSKLKELESKIIMYENALEEKQKEIMDLKAAHGKDDDEIINLGKEKIHLDQKMRELEEEITLLKEKEDTWSINNNECALLEMKLQKMEEENNKIYNSFDSEREFIEKEKLENQAIIQSLQNSIEEKNISLNNMESKLKTSETKLVEIEEQFNKNKHKEFETYQNHLKTLESDIEQLKTENSKLNAIYEETKIKLDEYQNNSTDQQKNYEIKIDNLNKENKKAKTIIKKDKDHIEKLNKDLEEKIQELEKTDHVSQALNVRISELENLLQQTEAENSEKIKKEKEYHNELLHRVQEFENESKKKNSENETLEKQLQNIESNYIKERKELESQLENLKQIENHYSDILQANNDLKLQISNLSQEYKEIENEKILHVTKLQNLENDYEKLEIERKKSEEEFVKLKALEIEFKKLESEKIFIEEELLNLKSSESEKQLIKNDLDRLRLIEEEKLKLEENLLSINNDFLELTSKHENLYAQLKEFKILEEKYFSVVKENENLLQELSALKEINNDLTSKNTNFENTSGKISEYETKITLLTSENHEMKENFAKLQEQINELQSRNKQISNDNQHILEENTNLCAEIESVKLKLESLETEKNEFDIIKSQINSEKEKLQCDLSDSKNELEKIQKEKTELIQVRNSNVDTENEISRIQQDFYDIKEKCDNLFLENKNLKTELSKLELCCDDFSKSKKQFETQVIEMEHQYNEIMHEKQLMQDEIQELKISPINLQNNASSLINEKTKLDNLEILKQEKTYNTNSDNPQKYLEEIECLKDKVIKYKSLDLTNKSSLEFYENELQKLKTKNEKLNRKLDETIVTLNHCAELSNSTEIEYLKNVLYNYMLGKEGLVLARVIAAVCKFDPQMTETVLQKEQQKQTLLGHLGIL